MANYDSTIIIICLAVLSYFVHNNAVTISILILLTIQLTPLSQLLPYIEKHGIYIGIIILTISVMAPLASGSLTSSSLLKSFSNSQSILAIIIGIFVAWLGGRGIHFMTVQPSIIGGLLIGTAIGVAFCRGVPVGPLIAAGIVSLFFTTR
ncbi:DUF441 domain-containing protein [Pantoea sp. Aalb]|uniref:DUF441 domain-containing protein n=1 Tax=Pantoea sp. Aalb TaxID=2576762 RepID=UPI0013251D76|nr:DUF441 domain-containing protein [Pantoea sp. Aalb]MXP67691.1 DUF441 domain-containing protein [Pantoea sp. Aalb]